MDQAPRYWFPAHRYGWGWGLPATWEGWVVLAFFTLLMLAGSLVFPPERNFWYFLGYVLLLTFALVGVCWLRGEPPRWRWGGE